MDWSVDLEVPGQIGHVLMVDGLKTIIDVLAKHGITADIIGPNLEVLKHWVERGMRWMSDSTDGAILLESTATVARQVRDACRNG